MSILIVDDENNTLEALRTLLNQSGHKVVWEAHHGEEALKIIQQQKSKLRMIIADWEMPYMDGLTLLKNIAPQEDLQAIPFLLITSDLPKNRIESFRKENPRLDHFLFKPFRRSTLASALSEAFKNRVQKARTLLYCASSLPDTLPQHPFDCLASAEINLELLNRHKPAAIVIDPVQNAASLANISTAIAQYKKTLLGASMTVICESLEPAEINPLRTSAQRFVQRHATTPQWQELLGEVQAHRLQAWDVDVLSLQFKDLLQAKNYAKALSLAQEILKLDPTHTETLGSAGDAAEHEGKYEQALSYYTRILRINPCVPRPYLKLLMLAQKGVLSHSPKELAQQALAFCPQHAEVQKLAAAVLQQDTAPKAEV